MSCFCATCDMVSCCPDQDSTSAASSPRMPCRRQKTRASRLPNFAVVAAAALAMSWNSAATYRQPVASSSRDQLAAQRVLVRVLRHREAAQVADHLQDVLVDRVDVEQVVLIWADDAAEHRQVAAEDRPLVHPPQAVHRFRGAGAGSR